MRTTVDTDYLLYTLQLFQLAMCFEAPRTVVLGTHRYERPFTKITLQRQEECTAVVILWPLSRAAYWAVGAPQQTGIERSTHFLSYPTRVMNSPDLPKTSTNGSTSTSNNSSIVATVNYFR